MKKGVFSLVFVLFFVSILAACAPDREEEQADGSEVDVEDIEKPEVLSVWIDDDDDDIEALTAIAEKYEEENDITIEFTPIGARDQADAMALDGPSGNGPDLWFATHNSMGKNILQGSAAPFEISDEEKEQYLPEAINAMTHDGEVYNIPMVVETTALFYNKSLIPEAPETWEDLESFSEDFNDTNNDQYGFLYDAVNFYYSNMFLQGYGGYIFGGDAENGYDVEDIGLDNDGAVKGAELIQSWFDKGYIPKTVNEDVMNGLFSEGKVGAVISGPWSINSYRDALGDDLGVVELPKLDNGENPPSFLGIKGWVLSPYSENKEWATDLALYFTNEESSSYFFEVASEIPARPGILESDIILEDPYFSAFAQQALYAVPTPNNAEMSQTWEPMANALSFLAEDEDPYEVLNEAVDFIQENIQLAQ